MALSTFEVLKTVNEAKETLRAVERNTSNMVDLITGNLRSVPSYKLENLKKELRDFNMHTGRWKS